MTRPANRLRRIPGISRLARIFADDAANVAIIFAVAAPIIIGTIGAGIDFSRASAMRSSLQQSVDSTSQTLTDRVNTCHEKNRTNNITTDTGCLNDPAYVAALRADAQTLLTDNFRQRGFTTAPTISGPVTLDKINGRMSIEATVGYNCVVFRVLQQDCNIQSRSISNANLSTQAGTMSIAGPSGNVRIYVGDGSINLPLSYTVTGGWAPFTFAVAGLPSGLGTSHTAGQNNARIVGAPSPSDATGCGLPNPCDPLALPATQVIAEDSGDQNRAGLNRQRVQSVVNFTLIRPLRVSISGVMTTQPNANSSTYYADARRSGGTGLYTYTCSGVPSGMTCNASSGRVSGNPSYWQSGTLTITVRDSTDARTASASIPYNFTPPALDFTYSQPSLTGNSVDTIAINATATGGVGTLTVSCANLPAGFTHVSNPSVGTNAGTISGKWIANGSTEAGSTLTCTAQDQAGQSKSAPLGWYMTYVGNTDCLTNPAIKCPGTFKGEFNNCVNGNGRLACQQRWIYQGGSSELPESAVPKPNESMGVPSHNGACTSDGTPLTPIKGCQGTFYGCVADKKWNRGSYTIECYPRAN